MDKILFSERLTTLRKKRGYDTQYALATAYNKKFNPEWRSMAEDGSGILGTIKHYENANHTGIPKLDIVCNLCELLNCDIDYLTGKIPVETHIDYSVMEQTGLGIDAVNFLTSLKHRADIEKEKGYIGFMAFATHELKALNYILENNTIGEHDFLSTLYSLTFGDFNRISVSDEGEDGKAVTASGLNAALINSEIKEMGDIIRVGDMQNIFLVNLQEFLLDLRDKAQGKDRRKPSITVEM